MANQMICFFKTPGGYYTYNAQTNLITQLSKCDFQSQIEKHSLRASDEVTLNENRKNQTQNCIVKEIVHPLNETVECLLQKKLYMITLQLTQQCNLRCEYCVYSGLYENRTHSNQRMSLATAKNAIDFLISHSADSENIVFGFYGGEPLLEFDLLTKCVEYAEKNGEGKNISFTITTNGTLLNKEVSLFLSEHDIDVLVSLDGPRHVHNKNRRFASNNSGTFEQVMENIERIKSDFPLLFQRIHFNVVMDVNNDFSCINDFFLNYETIKDSVIMSQYISDNFLFPHEQDKVNEFKIKIDYERFKLHLYELGVLDTGFVSKLVRLDYEHMKRTMHTERNLTKSLPERGCPGGPCIPGVTRLLVNVHGDLYPCERVSESSPVMKIGNLENGFNLDRIKQLLNIAQLTKDNCSECWAFRFCTQCIKTADSKDELSAEARLSHCNSVKLQVKELFKDYCTYREFQHVFLDNNALYFID